MNKFYELLRFDGNDLATDFEKASIQGRGTPQEVADFRENSFNKFLCRYFPFPHRISKGIIHDYLGNQSDSIDSIIINPCHPHTIDSASKFSLILADGVDLAIEIKPDISTYAELERGAKQIQSVKKLIRRKSPIIIQHSKPVEIVTFSRKIPSFIFSMKCNASPEKTSQNLLKIYEDLKIPIQELIDYVVINKVGIIANYKFPELSMLSSKETGIFFEEWGEFTLSAFLYRINSPHLCYPSQSMVGENIIAPYLNKQMPAKVQKISL